MFRSSRWFLLCALGLAAVAYLPASNNGFIADDYVILARAEVLKANPFYLFTVPPDNFRLMTHLVFGVVKQFAGYMAVWAVPGWKPDMVVVDRSEVCEECRRVRWNPETRHYE